MNLRSLVLLSCVALAGCGDDPADGESGSSSSGEASTVTNPTTSLMTSTNGSMSATTTTDGSTETTNTTETTAPADSSSGGTETGNADSSSTESGGSDSSGTDSGGTMDAYGPCDLENEPQCPMDQECVDVPQLMVTWCAASCATADDCPAAPGGDAEVACAGPNDDVCVLDCAGDAQCPDGMMCVPIFGDIERCVWPY